MFMRQTPTSDGVGHWRVGGATCPSNQVCDATNYPHYPTGYNEDSDWGPFGRFAGGFAHPDDATAAIEMELDEGLFGGLPVSDGTTFVIRGVYLDDAAGSFSVGYDAAGSARPEEPIAKVGGGAWKE